MKQIRIKHMSLLDRHVLKKLYHVTSTENSSKIMAMGFIIPKVDLAHLYVGKMKKSPGSFGFGIYGFLGDRVLATRFWQKNHAANTGCIITIEVDIAIDSCLNFVDDLQDMRYFSEFLLDQETYQTLDNFKRRFKNRVTQHELDGALLEYYIQQSIRSGHFETVSAICCATTSSLYRKIETYIPNGIEYCIRSGKILKMTIEEDNYG